MQNTQAKDDAMAALDEEFDFTFYLMIYKCNDPTECVGLRRVNLTHNYQ